MSLALWEFNWLWGGTAPGDSGGGSGGKHGGGHGDHPMDGMQNFDDLWNIREQYLRSLFPDPLKRQRAYETELDWPEPILKARRKRT